ncbi:spore germination protein [Cohnella lubricantis]|uniref:Spore germination protein n=1 Tax=Cohnella lubricantis TaxID=2163172 RepID=A0A841TA93_9BACL|nr:spore germination protein [Cohnella lubricantis]MBB6677902.1 spore germination protein [Cohnella lubricantis]MBP2119085.1 hypothetical protein [Cohnella lubricantis]
MKADRLEPQVWTEERLRDQYKHLADVCFQTCRFGEATASHVVLVYADGLINSSLIGQVVIPELRRLYALRGEFELDSGLVSGSLPLIPLSPEATIDDISDTLFSGTLLILFSASPLMYSMNLDLRPTRMPTDSNTEISIKGPRDCFVEDLVLNVALIRKRLRNQSLAYESLTIGTRTKTRVGLMYMTDITNEKMLNLVRDRLNRIDVDGIYSINQLEEYLADSRFTIFPTMNFTGRPDFVVNSLLDGRFIVLVDGIPLALIGPSGLTLILKSPEDIHFNYMYVSFSRLIRGLSLFLSIFLPGIWVALMAFHQDQVPFRLMATVAVSRLGLPLSAQMEMFILLLLLEIFREAGIRLPSNIGQTLASIGGLIIGDAAIRAGLVSPSVVVIGAITAVSGVTLVNQSLSAVVSVLRFFFFIMGGFLGLFGLILGLILLAAYMTQITSFGRPYMAPWSPPAMKEFLQSFIRVPWAMMKERASEQKPIDTDHQGKGDERS